MIRDRQEGVEALADGPGEAFAFRFVLRVARGHVDGEEVGGHDVGGRGGVGEVFVDVRVGFGVEGWGADDEAEFDFVVERDACGADDGAGGGGEDGGGGFEEEEGLGGAGGGEFGDVVAVGRGG